jgi:hypothetical protein
MAHMMKVQMQGGYYRATTEAFTKVVESYLPATTDELRVAVSERGGLDLCEYETHNMAELLMILADFETGSMALQAAADQSMLF